MDTYKENLGRVHDVCARQAAANVAAAFDLAAVYFDDRGYKARPSDMAAFAGMMLSEMGRLNVPGCLDE